MDTNRDCGCASAFGRIEALVDGHLRTTETVDVIDHCASCDSCAQELDIVSTLTERVKTACITLPPDGMCDEILSSLRATP
jgi:hypothetical protein